VALAIGWLSPPVNRLYFREVDDSLRMLDCHPDTLFIALAKAFRKQNEIVTFEIDGEIVGSQCKADKWIHPHNTISVIYMSPFLHVVLDRETVFVEWASGMRVGDVAAQLERRSYDRPANIWTTFYERH
jgi:hypothetical protein